MGRYAELAFNAGARIVGGCCGTSPEHLAGMRVALDACVTAAEAGSVGDRPSIDTIVADIGPLANQAPKANAEGGRIRRRDR